MDSRRSTRFGFFPLFIGIATLTSALVALPTNVVAQSDAGQSLTPKLQQRRTQLLQRLKIATYLLEREDYDRAARYFNMPPGAEPSMLESLIRNRETSQAGVKRLEDEAKFGPATEIFTAERAIAFAKKPGVPVEECFGFNHKTDQGAGEVLAVWRDGSPKIIRLDDVGKIGLPDAWPSADFQGKPDQATLIRTLETAYTLINGFQFDAASKLFVIPDDGDPAELFTLIENDEISPAGIKLLDQKATFGSAADAVGQDRAKILAGRVGVDPAECYGMALETTQDTGEVLAHWNGTRFRIFRLNNLAKMVPQQATSVEPGVRWYQLVRFIPGRDDMHRISVTLKEKPSEDEIESWTAILKAAKVQLNDE